MFSDRNVDMLLMALRFSQGNLYWYKDMFGDDKLVPGPAPTNDEINELCESINFLEEPKVVIEVHGGVAEVAEAPDWIEVEVIDYDNMEDESWRQTE